MNIAGLSKSVNSIKENPREWQGHRVRLHYAEDEVYVYEVVRFEVWNGFVIERAVTVAENRSFDKSTRLQYTAHHNSDPKRRPRYPL